MHTFAPVWLSSRDHLRAFGAPYLNASWLRRYLWPPEPPRDFPQTRVGSRRVPLVLFATGTLTVRGNAVAFRAIEEPRYENVEDDLEFEIQLDRRTGIDRHFMESPLLKQFSWSWVALRSPELDDELLLCVGGTGLSVTGIRENTDRLFRILQDAKAEAV
jgi:hypothetical protein